MEDLTFQRWIEVQFYYICVDITGLNNNPMDLMDLIDNLTILGSYTPELIKTLAQELLCTVTSRPTKEEVCLLSYKYGILVKDIKTRTGIHNRTLYNMISEEEQNPRTFYPRFNSAQITQIEKFVNDFNKLKRVGL